MANNDQPKKSTLAYIVEDVLTPKTSSEVSNQTFTLSEQDLRTLVSKAINNDHCISSRQNNPVQSDYDRSRLVPMDPYSVVSADMDGNVLNLSINVETLAYVLLVIVAVIAVMVIIKSMTGGSMYSGRNGWIN